MGTSRNGRELRRDKAARMQDLLHRIEPELRSLQGAAVLLRAVSDTADSIDPIAFKALAHLVDEPLERIEACWREAFDASRVG